MSRSVTQFRGLLPTFPQRLRVWSAQAATERAFLAQQAHPDTTELEEFLAHAPPSMLRNSHYLAMLLFLSILLIASLVSVDVIVSGSGRLVADAPTVVVQPMQLSIVRELRVKAGDIVHRGEVLATLDPTFAQADLAALTARRAALQAEAARLQAELDGTPFDPAPGGADRDLQLTLYTQRTAQYRARIAEFEQKIDSTRTDIAAADANRALLSRQAEVVQEVQAMRGTLYDSKIGSKLTYLSSQVDRMRTDRELAEAATRLSELRHALRTAEADRQAFVDTWRRELLEAQVKLRGDVAMVGESLAKATRFNDLVVLTAPEDGVVLEVAHRSVGSVLHEAEPLVTLVPAGAPLIADISISSADVGYPKVGDEAVVKVDAFPYQRHGLLPGRLRAIGEESISAAGGSTSGLFHRSQVTLSDTTLKNIPPGVGLIPGMTVTAEIKVGTRSVISYFLYPIIRSIRESMREP